MLVSARTKNCPRGNATQEIALPSSETRSRMLYTIGVYGTTARAFFNELEQSGIDIVLDIRRRRAVRGSLYTFANAERLTAELEERGIAYKHVIGLAPDVETLKLQGEADELAHIRKSDREALSPQYIAQYTRRTLRTFDFAALANELRPYRAPVLLCIERNVNACHRGLVAPKLQAAMGVREVIHLLPSGAAFEAQRALREVQRNRAKIKRKYG